MKSLPVTYVKIDNYEEFPLGYLISTVTQLKGEGTWTFKTWNPTPALVDKKSGTTRFYVGQNYDPKYFDLIQDGWTHDHCEICSKRIMDKEDYAETHGYELDGNWICQECYDIFMAPDDIEKELHKYPKVVR
ncbi:hypothetical protein [uncultured Imperialibacter sp.]|uniref:hypothetical protein n=1 Tax=uncultured Imperialibacter sp. TaxID=1672639 RepID=UPI0030D9FCE8|tara:strand:- start:1186 stop:1581 length:396 start_codon:yes stop_codon:yes gene_type:complete